MKKAMRIFRRDLRRLIHSPAAMLVMAGVAILPSLYAWFNIAANIDPYANTSAIQIAVANNDEDASTNDLTINAGDQIMENLKENDQLGWVFTSEEKAVDGVRSGKYYAAIVIPEDFSDSLLSVLSGTLETPELNYYINEKVNAIAPKITDTGASTIQTQINDTFSSIAAESVSEVLKESISDLSGTVNSTNSEIVSLLKKADKNLNEYEALLTEFTEKTSQSHDLISDAKDASDSLGNAAVSGASTLENAQDALKTGRQAAGDFSSSLSKSISDGEQILNSANSSVSSGLTSLEGSAGKINQSLQVDSLDDRIFFRCFFDLHHGFFNIIISLRHRCAEVSCDSLFGCHLTYHPVNLICGSIHAVFSVSSMTMHINKSRDHISRICLNDLIVFLRYEISHFVYF